ncbi:MAG: MFS transporter [Planctomycetaceae bacterium]
MPERQPLPDDLWRDVSFWGMTATQFLGAFNDNLFKQVVLLMCVDYSIAHQTRDLQPFAQAIFAIPFVLFSGFAGFLADRHSKRTIVVLCKLAEILIVSLGIAALSSGALAPVFVVLFLLGMHSAFFGPSKYGILPELVREKNLPAANGIFLMTTFAAIILGMGAAGVLKQRLLPDSLGWAAAAYLGVSLCGLATSLLVRKTAVARPGLAFDWYDLLVSGETVNMFRRDRPLLLALAMFSLFWLMGGVVQPAVNAFGKVQLALDDERTSFMLGFLVIGISIGCAAGGWLSHERVEFRLVSWGAWGMVAGLALFAVWGSVAPGVEEALRGSRGLLFEMGCAAGLFTVPLQVFLQSRPPVDQKGRVIGAMNLVNWIGILLSAVVYGALERIVTALGGPISWVFGALALLLLPVALLYRPREGSSS